MKRSLLEGVAERAVLSSLRGLQHGSLNVTWPGGIAHINGSPGLTAALDVRDSSFFRRALFGGEIGLGESYMNGGWDSPDLVALIELILANRDVLDRLPAIASWPQRFLDTLSHARRRNSRRGSRDNIRAHYDLSNEFFELFLDGSMIYSCALFEPGDSLEQAQERKLRAICEQAGLQRGDHVLEIGGGWGAFAMFAVTHYGCRVTTTTISQAQHDYARERFRRAGIGPHQIDLRLDDYRDLRGRFDKIVSIEMFEAVGLDNYDAFFGACDRLLHPHGSMLLQTITVDDWRFEDYLRTPSWIAKYIFPGSELASVAEILASLARVSRLGLASIRQIGPHYAPTLAAWRSRFNARRDDVTRLGFDERFVRMWDLYLAYCEAAFASRHIGNAQLVLHKTEARRRAG